MIKIFLQIIKWVATILIGLSLLILIAMLVYKTYLKYSTKIETLNGISSLEKITLGGLEQWIFIRSEDKKNPVLIFLHGGPGSPMGGMSSSRKYDAELIKHFTVVHWDQRGAGKSYCSDIPIDSMTHERLVEDCNELIDYVRNKFDTPKVFIVGHSAGSVIGLKTVHKYPWKIHAYVGVAQIIDEYEKQRIAYKFVVKEAVKFGDVNIQNEIITIGPPPYDKHEKDLEKAKYIVQYGGFIRDNPIKQIGLAMLAFLTTPEYSLLEGIRTFGNEGLDFTMDAMWEEIKNINLTNEIQSINVPTYFFVGKYDMITPAVLVEKFYKNLDALKGKHFIVFEHSAHVPMLEEKEKYEDLLINLVLKESLPN
jgi:pimeloyl-ACP methyl ester carboxylesterase